MTIHNEKKSTNPIYLTVSYELASKRIVQDIFVAPPRPNMNTLDGDRNIPLDATFDLKFKVKRNDIAHSKNLRQST